MEEITARLLIGEQISPQALADDYPQYASELASMMSTMSALADWGDSVGPAGSAVPQAGVPDAVVEHHRPLGDFRLIREIARGGMGIVYEAEQLSLARRVALKVLPLAAMLDEKQRKRFQNEATDGQTLATGSLDGVINLWDVASRQVVRTVRGHSAAINDVSFRPDGKTLVTGTIDRIARFWNLEENIEPSELRGHPYCVPKLAVSKDGQLLASSSLDGTGGLWEVQTGKRLGTFRRPRESVPKQLWGLDISPDGKTVAVGAGRWRRPDIPGELWLWDTASKSSRTLYSGLADQDEGT